MDPPELTRLTFSRGSIRSARFAPDGKTVVFGAAWDELPDADVLSVSPSGEMALCVGRSFRSLFDASGTLARAPVGGRAPRDVLEAVQTSVWRRFFIFAYAAAVCTIDCSLRVW